MIRFDIIFYVRMKDELSQIIINVEAQKDEPDGYQSGLFYLDLHEYAGKQSGTYSSGKRQYHKFP